MDTLLTLAIAFIAGIIIYFIDLKAGRRWNTGWYNLTHQHRSPVLLPKGLIHLQPFTRKLFMAILLSGLYTVIAILAGGSHALLDLYTGGLGVIGMMLGFYAGVLIFRSRFNLDPVREVLKKADQMEARAHAHETPATTVPEPVHRTGVQPKEAPSPEEEKPDWRAGIKKFTDKK
jgi:hypothetical protein